MAPFHCNYYGLSSLFCGIVPPNNKKAFPYFCLPDESLDEFSSEEAKELESVLLSVQHEEEFGEPLLPVVASTYELVASQHLKKEDFEEIKSRYKVPTNCKHLGVPKVNPEIWKNSNLSKRVKINDAKIQFVQHGISKAMVVLANSTETIIKNAKMIPSDTGKRVTSALLDAAKLLGTSMRELTSQRRTQFRSVLAVDISDTPAGASEYLFGDNLDDRVKASKTSSSLVKSDGFQQRRPQRFTPYSRPSTQTKQFQGNYSQGTPRNSQNLNSRWPPQVRGGGQNRWKTSRPPQSRFPQHQ